MHLTIPANLCLRKIKTVYRHIMGLHQHSSPKRIVERKVVLSKRISYEACKAFQKNTTSNILSKYKGIVRRGQDGLSFRDISKLEKCSFDIMKKVKAILKVS